MHTLLIKYPCGKTEKWSTNAEYSSDGVARDLGEMYTKAAEAKYTGEFTCRFL